MPFPALLPSCLCDRPGSNLANNMRLAGLALSVTVRRGSHDSPVDSVSRYSDKLMRLTVSRISAITPRHFVGSSRISPVLAPVACATQTHSRRPETVEEWFELRRAGGNDAQCLGHLSTNRHSPCIP